MIVTVKLFARARDVVGSEAISIAVSGGHTVADLRRTLCERHPDLKPFAAGLLFAVDAKYAGETTLIRADADIACFPPVSGG
jgi:molybdopterin converting factor small subunit